VENPTSLTSTYGGEKANEFAVRDNNTQCDADHWNALGMHVGQMSHGAEKVRVHFPTISTLTTTTPTATKTQWGDTSSYYPTSVTRTATGRYTIVYPSSFTNELGAAETVSFSDADGKVTSNTVYGKVQCTVTGATILVSVFDAAGALTDITNGTTLTVWAY
jgi:hypothetical protein